MASTLTASGSSGVKESRIELDEVLLLGKFVEIEGPNEQTVNQAKSDLGFESAKNITQSYVKMLSAVCESSGIKSDFIRF